MRPRCLYSRAGLELDVAVQRILVSDYLELAATHRYPKSLSCVKHFPEGSRQGLLAWVFILSLRGGMLTLGYGISSLTSGRRSRVDKNIADSSDLCFCFAV